MSTGFQGGKRLREDHDFSKVAVGSQDDKETKEGCCCLEVTMENESVQKVKHDHHCL